MCRTEATPMDRLLGGRQVALQRWVAANVTSVVALYEDRHELWGFTHQGRLVRRVLPARRAKVCAQRPAAPAALAHALVRPRPSLLVRACCSWPPAGRSDGAAQLIACLYARWLGKARACWCWQDVAGLRGVRYAVGLALEALDFAAPLLQRALAKLGDALAWLLVRLIGRSLGLVYRGVRESLAPLGRRSRPPPGQGRRRGPPRPRYAPL